MTQTPAIPPLKFTSHSSLRRRLVLATLTGRPIHISQIRSTSLTPGLTSSEISLLRLLDAVTNGSYFEISVTGTTFIYKPGQVTGNNGKLIRHTLPENCTRGVSYYLEVLALLAPFSTGQFSVILDGGVITSATAEDYSVDTFRTALLPLFAHFNVSRNIELRILKRSSGVVGGKNGGMGAGEVHFLHGHQVRDVKTLHLQSPGRVKRIRGVAYSTGVSAANNARMIEAARGVLNPFIPDVYVFSDVSSAQTVPLDYGKEGAASTATMKSRLASGRTKKTGIGFGLSLIAETGSGTIFSTDAIAGPAEPAEDVGKRAAYQLLEEVSVGGCVGRIGVMTVLTMMMTGVVGDVGRVTLGRGVVDESFVEGLRDLKKAFGGEVGMREVEDGREEGMIAVSVVGKGAGVVGKKAV